MTYTLSDLAEFRPALAAGLRQLLDFDGDVESTFCRDFVAEIERYGSITTVPLCPNGENKAVTNENRHEFVELPEEIELLIRGSDEALDVSSVRAVAVYEGWKDDNTNKALSRDDVEELWVIRWFWELFEGAGSQDQRKLLSFITGSDRIPAVGATNLVVKIVSAGPDSERFPVARTCFNQLVLPQYGSRRKLENKLWRAVRESGGFGLK
ncbi:putative E3 ubiquitin-protein ligase [Cryomyces antarcticus]|nr:putative E3 ubiquitin-protein ligase [Cryomyces antarcticus]